MLQTVLGVLAFSTLLCESLHRLYCCFDVDIVIKWFDAISLFSEATPRAKSREETILDMVSH